MHKLLSVISKNKINVLFSAVSLYLATNITILGPLIAIPTTLIVLCRSSYKNISAKAYKCSFIVAIALAVLLANTNNPIAYPIINDIVQIDLSRISTTLPSAGDNFVLLTKAEDYLLQKRLKNGKLTQDWVNFRVSEVKVTHPDLSTSISITLVPIETKRERHVEYVMFDHNFKELKESGILISNYSSLTSWWVLTF